MFSWVLEKINYKMFRFVEKMKRSREGFFFFEHSFIYRLLNMIIIHSKYFPDSDWLKALA